MPRFRYRVGDDLKEHHSDEYKRRVICAILADKYDCSQLSRDEKMWRSSIAQHIRHQKSSSELRAKRKHGDTKRKMEVVNVSMSTWADKLGEQDFRCYFSDLTLFSDTISPDRIDNNRGYIPENFVLVHPAFQAVGKPWTKELFNEVKVAHTLPVTLNTTDAKIWIAQKKAGYNVESVDCPGNIKWFETIPQIAAYLNTAVGNVYSTLIGRCKTCRGHTCKYVGDHMKAVPPLFLKLRHLVADAKSNAGRKGLEHTIDAQNLFDILEQQEMRCAYSGVPLDVEGKWVISVERLDEAHGYNMGNVVLIARIFNTGGTWQWSRDFVDYIWN